MSIFAKPKIRLSEHKPSKDDDRLTERVKNACELMRLYLLDHVIVTDGDYYSFGI